MMNILKQRRNSSTSLLVAKIVLFGFLLILSAPILSAQPIDWTEEEYLAAAMKDNLIKCRGYESDLLSFTDEGHFPKLYAQLSPDTEVVNVKVSDAVTSLYMDIVNAHKNKNISIDLNQYYQRFEKLEIDKLSLSDQQIWAIARSHYYLTYFQLETKEDVALYHSFSDKLINQLLNLKESDIRDRAIIYVASNISALDFNREKASIYRDKLIIFYKYMKNRRIQIHTNLNRRIAGFKKFSARNFSVYDDYFYEKLEFQMGFYKSKVENDLILLFQLQASSQYLFIGGEYRTLTAGLPSMLTGMDSVSSLAAICSTGLFRANAKLLNHFFYVYGPGSKSKSVTSKFIINFFDFDEQFTTKFWFDEGS